MKESFRRFGRFGKDREIEEKHEIDVEDIKNFYPSQIDILMKNTFDKKLNDLVNNLIKFRREEQQMIKNNTTMPLYNFKKILFKQIELILCQIAESDNKLERMEGIEKLYKWYKNKTNFFYTLLRMNKKSYYEAYEKYDEKTMKEIAKNKNKIKIEDDEDKEDKEDKKLENNNNEGNKGIINEIHEPIVLRKNKLSALLYNNSSNPAKFYYKKTERKSLKPEDENIDNKKEEKDEENKSTERKRKNATSININDRIIELKNKFLAEKSSQSEMKNILEEFGKNRANFKSNLNKKFEIKKIIKQYKIKNSFNKQLQTFSNLSIKNQNNRLQNYNDNFKYDKRSYNFGDNSRNIKNTNINTNINTNTNSNTITNTNTMINNNKSEEIQEPKDNQINNDIKNESKNKDNIEEKKKERSQCVMHKKRLNKIILSKVKNISENNMLITSNIKDYKDNYELHTYQKNENPKKVKSTFFLTGTDNYDDPKDEEEIQEKIINVQVQFPKLKTSKTLMLDKINEYDSFMKNIMLDPLYRAKRKYSYLCSINNSRDKRCDTSDSNRSYSNINDNENENGHDIDHGNNNISLNSNDISDFTKKTLASESIDKNFLNIKKGFDILKKKEYFKLKNLMKLRDHYRFVNKSALFEAFTNPPKSNKYPMLYLPCATGSNLLLKPIIK
jgi:hypothetical protein